MGSSGTGTASRGNTFHLIGPALPEKPVRASNGPEAGYARVLRSPGIRRLLGYTWPKVISPDTRLRTAAICHTLHMSRVTCDRNLTWHDAQDRQSHRAARMTL
jgi:hypothetical protein